MIYLALVVVALLAVALAYFTTPTPCRRCPYLFTGLCSRKRCP